MRQLNPAVAIYIAPAVTLVAAIISSIVAIGTLWNARKIEYFRSYSSYLNLKLTTLLKEFGEYEAVLLIEEGRQTPDLVLRQYNNCVPHIRVLGLFTTSTGLRRLQEIQEEHSRVTRAQQNAMLQGQSIPDLDPVKHTSLLSEYVELGDTIFREEVRKNCVRLEQLSY